MSYRKGDIPSVILILRFGNFSRLPRVIYKLFLLTNHAIMLSYVGIAL